MGIRIRSQLRTAACLLAAAVVAAADDPGDALIGRWWTPDRTAQIAIARHGAAYRGIVAWGAAPRTDARNPDPALRGRDLLGAAILDGFAYAAEAGRWEGGTIYDPDEGRTYRAVIRRDARGDLAVRGYVGLPAFGRTAIFAKVAPGDERPPPGPPATAPAARAP